MTHFLQHTKVKMMPPDTLLSPVRPAIWYDSIQYPAILMSSEGVISQSVYLSFT